MIHIDHITRAIIRDGMISIFYTRTNDLEEIFNQDVDRIKKMCRIAIYLQGEVNPHIYAVFQEWLFFYLVSHNVRISIE